MSNAERPVVGKKVEIDRVRLSKIDRDNFQFALSLKVKEHQKRFVPDVLYTIGLAYTSFASRQWDPYLIQYKDDFIGSMTLSRNEKSPFEVSLSGFFISEERQNQGLGSASMDAIIKEIVLKWPDTKRLVLLVHEENIVAKKFYLKYGFADTPHVFGDEVLMEMLLKE